VTDLNRAHPEQWMAFIGGDIAGIAAWVVTRSVPLALVAAGVAYMGLYFALRARQLRRERS